MLFHFCFKQNHKIGGGKCPSPLPNEELSPRNLPKKNSTLLTVPWFFSKIETTDIYTTERRQDANRGRLAPGPGLFITPLPPAIEAVSSWTHSTSIHALQNRQARPRRWKLHGSCHPLEVQKNPLLEWNKNIKSDRIYPSFTFHYSLLLFLVALHFRSQNLWMQDEGWKGE